MRHKKRLHQVSCVFPFQLHCRLRIPSLRSSSSSLSYLLLFYQIGLIPTKAKMFISLLASVEVRAGCPRYETPLKSNGPWALNLTRRTIRNTLNHPPFSELPNYFPHYFFHTLISNLKILVFYNFPVVFLDG